MALGKNERRLYKEEPAPGKPHPDRLPLGQRDLRMFEAVAHEPMASSGPIESAPEQGQLTYVANFSVANARPHHSSQEHV